MLEAPLPDAQQLLGQNDRGPLLTMVAYAALEAAQTGPRAELAELKVLT